MRIQFKCSCGAEAEFYDERSVRGEPALRYADLKPDEQGRIYHVEVVADRWLADHAKCREAMREDAAPTLVGEDENWLHFRIPRKAGVIFTKSESMPDVYAKPPEPAKECEHDWHRELVGPDPSGESVAVDTCRKCQRKEVGRDLA